MTRKIKWLLLATLLIASCCTSMQAQTIRAASCSQTDVQNAFNSVVAATTTVNIPSGTCNWTTKVNLNIPSGSTTLTVSGAGTCTGTPATSCNDSTAIVDNDTTDSDKLLNIVTNNSSSAAFRLTGITFKGGTGVFKQNGYAALQGQSTNMRIDHDHFDCTSYSPGHNGNIRFTGGLLGVVDHFVMDSNDASSCGFEFWEDSYGGNADSNGDHSFSAATGFGTNKFIYLEDGTFNNNGTSDHSMDDCSHGGRFVVRHNTLNRQGIQTHSTASGGRGRGCRAIEVYLNTFTGNNTNPNGRLFFFDSGTLLTWSNTAGTGYTQFLNVKSQRSDNSTYPETATPNGWGYCGTFSGLAGAGSAWDENLNAVDGHACLDNPGTGQSDLLTGSFPNVVDSSTGTLTWPNQKQEPVYDWMNTWASTGHGGAAYFANQNPGPPPPIALNRDVYLWCDPSSNTGCTSTFNGTQGTGSGLLSARPATCTPLVAYWATDTTTLYQCSSTNTWTVYYTPYTYPHPLASGSGPPPPAPPSKLAAVVQ